MATPIPVSKRLLKIKEKIKRPVSAYMFHIKGCLKKELGEGDIQLFDPNFDVHCMSRQLDGTYLFYHKKDNPDLSKYFNHFEIISKKYWNPVINIDGHELLSPKRGENLYMIGDYNIGGLEDAFITGLYAANQIMC